MNSLGKLGLWVMSRIAFAIGWVVKLVNRRSS